jgi:hypothetical protein
MLLNDSPITLHSNKAKWQTQSYGHLTDVPLASLYSGLVSLRGFRLVLFLSKLNGMELWATDIGNAYLEEFTSEMVLIIDGPEFGDLEQVSQVHYYIILREILLEILDGWDSNHDL